MASPEQLQIIRGEIITIKSTINGLKRIVGNAFKLEYELDKNGNILLDEDGNPIMKEDGFGKIVNTIIDSFKHYINVEFSKDEAGNFILDEHQNKVLDNNKSGEISNLIVSELEKYFNLRYETTSDGNLIYDDNNNPIPISEGLGIIVNYIINQINFHFKIEDGQIPRYINDSFDKRFSLKDDNIGTVINYLKNEFKKVEDGLNIISEKADNIIKSLEILPEIASDAKSANEYAQLANTNAISAKNNSAQALLDIADVAETVNNTYELLTTIKGIVDIIDSNTKPDNDY